MMNPRFPPGRPQVIQGFFGDGMPSCALQRLARSQGDGPRSPRSGHAVQLSERLAFAPGPGQPMPPAVQRAMEASFGTDFSEVRVHVGPQAQQIGALAFTLGTDVHFAPGHYRPGDRHGWRLLAHELAHVVQQRSGRVRNPFGSGLAVVQDPGLEAEANRMALRAAASRPPESSPPPRHARRAPAARPGAAQPYIAKGTTVYYPSDTYFGQGESVNNFERSLRVLGSPPGNPLTAATATSWNQFATNQGGYASKAMGQPTGGKNQKRVKRQFLDPTTVYYYPANASIQDLQPTHTLPLLDFHDMAEATTGALPQNVNDQTLAAAKCVIESLEDMGVRVPNTQAGTVAQWHTHFRGQNLDYRQDNHYIVVYVRTLGFRLISTAVMAWNQWTPAVGRYVVMTYPNAQTAGAVGHAIGVVVTQGPNGIIKTIHDRQGLTANWNPIYVKYVFQI